MNLFISIGDTSHQVVDKLSDFFNAEFCHIMDNDLGLAGETPEEIEKSAVESVELREALILEYDKVYIVAEMTNIKSFCVMKCFEELQNSSIYFIGIFKSSKLKNEQGAVFLFNALQELRRSRMIDFLTFFSEDIIEKYDDEMTIFNRDERVCSKISQSIQGLLMWEGYKALTEHHSGTPDWDAYVHYQDYDLETGLSTETFFLDNEDSVCYYFVLSKSDSESKKFFNEFNKFKSHLDDNASYRVFVEEISHSYVFKKSVCHAPTVMER